MAWVVHLTVEKAFDLAGYGPGQELPERRAQAERSIEGGFSIGLSTGLVGWRLNSLSRRLVAQGLFSFSIHQLSFIRAMRH